MGKTIDPYKLGEQLVLKKVKGGWYLEEIKRYGLPNKKMAEEYAEEIGLKFREPIVDDIGNVTITT